MANAVGGGVDTFPAFPKHPGVPPHSEWMMDRWDDLCGEFGSTAAVHPRSLSIPWPDFRRLLSIQVLFRAEMAR